MKTCCYLQARGGSKRLPHKNRMLWHGVPFVADAIIKAQASKLFDLIMVSSDDTDILDIARKYGALPVLRSAEMSGDNVTDAQLAVEILRPLGRFDIVCKLYPCVPLLTADELRCAYVKLLMSDAEAVRAVDDHGLDAGAFWFYRMTDNPLDTLCKLDYNLNMWQDINTPADIAEAERKYENN